MDRWTKGRARPREKARSYDELVTLAQVALSTDLRVAKLLPGLHFRGEAQVLCAFLTAAAHAELRKAHRGPQLTPWGFLLEQLGLDDRTLTALPGRLLEVSCALQRIEGTFLDPAVELRRELPAETKDEIAEYAEGVRQFKTLPELLADYAECLAEIQDQRRAMFGSPSLKLTTLSKALLIRYVREHSRRAADGAPTPIYACSATLLGIVSGYIAPDLGNLNAKALQRVDERALAWTGKNKLYYDTFYQGFIRRYKKQQA